ncbi:MAG: hypothetical protein IKI77_01095 [Oscillospiraceae bacterium]|nr:hypothetical protein [Oscillospiraceae bacterium]
MRKAGEQECTAAERQKSGCAEQQIMQLFKSAALSGRMPFREPDSGGKVVFFRMQDCG